MATEIIHDHFSLNLPGDWRAVKDVSRSGLYVYEAIGGVEQLTVSLHFLGARINGEKMDEVFSGFVEGRMERERSAVNDVRLTIIHRKDIDGIRTGYYSGVDNSGRMLANYFLVTPVGVGNFYYEARDLCAQTFRARSSRVLSRVGFIR